MEKISIQSTFTQVSLYARYTAANSAKKNGAAGASDSANAAGAWKTAAEQSGAAGNGAAKGIACGQSKDGDTFSLSIEASMLQISETYTVTGDATGTDGVADTGASVGNAATNGAATTNADGKAADPERLTGGGLVHALMDALKSISGKNGATGAKGANAKHHHHFPQLADAQDVADNLMRQIDGRYAAQGGSKADFAAEIKTRLADWKPNTGKVTVAYQEFRSEVHLKLTQGLDAWAQSDAPDNAGSPSVGSASSADAVT